jgi:hypothetical protein
VDDALLESDETLQATISGVIDNVTYVGGGVGTATINESGATATLSGNTPAEGSNVVFTVTLSKENRTGATITFNLAKTGGTATTTDDHGAVPATIDVLNTASTGTANVTTVDDALLELDETLQATISGVIDNVTYVAAGVGTATITETGATANLLVVQDGDENGGTPIDIILRVRLMYLGSPKTNMTGSDVTVTLSDPNPGGGLGNATSGSDYTAFGGTVAIVNTTSETDVTVPVLDDGTIEGTENVDATISAPSPASVTLGTANATATITDDALGDDDNLSLTALELDESGAPHSALTASPAFSPIIRSRRADKHAIV